jgi:hypothetical protein
MNEAEVRRLVEKNNKGDTYEAIYGPVKIAGSVIWEVWVAFEDEWMARFVEEPETGPVKIYDTFQQLAIRLNDRHLEIMERLKLAEQAKLFDQTKQQSELAMKMADSSAKRMTTIIRDISTAAAFAISLLAFVYMLVSGANVWAATVMFACVLASACAFFYGKFILVKGRDLAGV